jgi:succinate-acetate transporter protein
MDDDSAAQHLAVTRIVLRPIGTPLPLGLLGLAVATVGFSALQLGWIPVSEGRVVALSALLLTAPLQLLASVYGFLARDPVAGTGMGILAGTWATAGAVTLTSPAGSTSQGLGVVLLTAALAMLVPVAAASGKLVAAGVMGLTATRFAVTGIYEITGSASWKLVAGVTGLVLAAAALCAATGFELEDGRRSTALPLLRRGPGRRALHGGVATSSTAWPTRRAYASSSETRALSRQVVAAPRAGCRQEAASPEAGGPPA